MKITPIVLAAGKGTRMGNPDVPKVLLPVSGEPMITFVLQTLAQTHCETPAIVVGYRADLVKLSLGNAYTYVEQDDQLGTGHAVAVCQEQVQGTADAFVILYGDQPLWSAATIENLVAAHQQTGAAISLATVSSTNPMFYNFGRIIRNAAGKIEAIREQRDCSEQEREITEYNPGLYVVSDQWVWGALQRIDRHNAQGEYYLTDLVGLAVEDGQAIASVLATEKECLGVNTPEQLLEVERALAN